MTRYIVWHIPNPGAPLPRFYVDRASEPAALRIRAETAPNGGDFLVDVLDDGVSIMNFNNADKVSISNVDGYIEFGTPSGTFIVKELVTGGTSSATARVSANSFGRLTLYDISAVFTAGETITGGTSGATGVVGTFVRPLRSVSHTTVVGQAHANLPKNKNANESAEDFQNGVQIAEGSWLSLDVLEANGASNITVQLELDALSESVESRRWAE